MLHVPSYVDVLGATTPKSQQHASSPGGASSRPWDQGSTTSMSEFDALDPERIRKLFDLRSEVYNSRGGAFEVDPYPEFHRLRERGPVHEGTVHELVGCEGDHFFQGLPYPDRPHYSAFSFE